MSFQLFIAWLAIYHLLSQLVSEENSHLFYHQLHHELVHKLIKEQGIVLKTQEFRTILNVMNLISALVDTLCIDE